MNYIPIALIVLFFAVVCIISTVQGMRNPAKRPLGSTVTMTDEEYKEFRRKLDEKNNRQD